MRFFLIFLAFASLAGSAEPANTTPRVPAAINTISANSLRGNLSFIASDLLEGRYTPSPGLDLAAEYIAAQFRRAGLAPAGDDGYFQTGSYVIREPNWNQFDLKLDSGGKDIPVDKGDIYPRLTSAIDLDNAAVIRFDPQTNMADLQGKVVLLELLTGQPKFAAFARSLRELDKVKPALILVVGASAGRFASRSQLTEAGESKEAANMIAVRGTPLIGDTLHLSLHAEAPLERTVKLRNVIAVLPGSDPILKDSYVLLTAHYDHIGTKPSAVGDKIYNGANDDGSGTVSVIEIGSALARLRTKPKRSIVFMTFYGEEIGGFGSRYYAAHPVFPIEKTIADVNLEQIGRTDSTEGPQIANATITGFTFSSLPATFQAAGALTGIKIYNNLKNGDAYFSRSDNQALANLGVPAHSLSTAFDYPDYHGLGDHWEKIDYDNMAKVDRMIALGLVMLANSPTGPKWNAANPKTAKYIEAWKQHHPK